MAASGLIADFLNLTSVLPVLFLFVTILFYFHIPLYYGVIQGFKNFYRLGLAQVLWGFSRAALAACIVLFLTKDLTVLFVGILAATMITVYVSRQFAYEIRAHPAEHIERGELIRAYSLIVPVVLMLVCVTVMKNIDVVFARKFFDSSAADAYACAALVGSGFFMLSGIFMVLFPVVSEENTRGGNPIIFLVKSFQIIIGFSVIGLCVAWFAPSVVMKIITLGKYIPGAESLIRLVGVAVMPVSLVYIISHYLLAKHQWRFIPVLFCGMIIQLLFIGIMHPSPLRMLEGVAIANWLTFIGMCLFVVFDHKGLLKHS